MRSLAKPDVLRNSVVAAAVTTLACWPRLALWFERQDALAFLLGMVFVCTFFLWDFVFAWHELHSGKPVFAKPEPKLWGVVTLAAIMVAFAKLSFADPVVRPLRPDEFPTDLASWAAMTLFGMGMTTLFLLFAPFAFFIRLTRHVVASVAGTVLVGMLVAYFAADSKEPPLPLPVLAGVLAGWAAGGVWALWLYLRGGACLVWWWGVVVQARHLADLP